MLTLSPGEKVLVLRKRQGLTQATLARNVGTSRVTINAVENARTLLTPELTEKIALALSVEPGDLCA